jgi:hypothetical protein
MGEIFGHLWNLLTSNMRVFLIVLIACLLFLHLYPEDATGNVLLAIRIALVVSVAGVFVSLSYYLWTKSSVWVARLNAKNTEKAKIEREAQFAYSSIKHLRASERHVLEEILTRADDGGLFRKFSSVQDAHLLNRLRERKIIQPSSHADLYQSAVYIEFWQVNPFILSQKERILRELKTVTSQSVPRASAGGRDPAQ